MSCARLTPPGWSRATPGGDQRSGRSQDSSISTLSAAEISFSMSTEPVLAPVSICYLIRLFQQSLVLGDRDYDESQADFIVTNDLRIIHRYLLSARHR